MAIEGVAVAAVAKDLAARAAVEAAKQIAQKMAGGVSAKCVETQAIDLERQASQEGFRLGEMNQPGSEELIASRAWQEQACNDLSQKLGTDINNPGELKADTVVKDEGTMTQGDRDVSDGKVHELELTVDGSTAEDAEGLKTKTVVEKENAEKLPLHETNEGRKTGGAYGELKGEWGGNLENGDPPREIHHMPSNSANGLETSDGPAIVMEKGDHQETASWGNSREAREYREKQRELVKQGKFEEAMQMDIDDIHDKFGNKYDDAIAQMKEAAKEKGLI